MEILKTLLSSANYIVVNRTLIKVFGLEEAVIMGELCAEYNYWEAEDKLIDDMFYCSATKLEDKTGLSEYQQRKALQSLKNAGVLDIQLKGLPATKYFKINTDKLAEFLQTSSKKTKELDVKKLHSSNNSNNNKTKNSILSKDKNTVDFQFGKKPTKQPTLYEKCINLIDDFTDDYWVRHSLTVALNMFISNSKESGTPFYTNNFKGKLNTLKSLSTDAKTQLDIIDQTITHGWNNFYPLNTKKAGKTGNVAVDIEGLDPTQMRHATAEEKRKFKEDIANGKAEKF